MLAIVPETGREVNGGCESAQKGEKKSPLFWGRGGWERLFPALLERAGTVPSRAGPHFSGEMGERAPRGFAPWTPVGERVSFPHTLSLACCKSGVVPSIGLPQPAASKTNAVHGPPTSSGGREKWFLDLGEKSGKRNGFSSPFPKGSSPTSSARPAGGRVAVTGLPMRAAGQVSRQKYSLPHTHPPESGVPGRNLSPGFFPLFLPRNRAPAGKPRFPAVPTAKERNRKPPVRASPAQTAPPPAPRTAGRRDG